MDSALCLHYGAHPTTTLCMPSTVSVARVPSWLHSNFKPSSLSLSPNDSKHRAPGHHALSPVISVLDKRSLPSKNDNEGKKFIVRGMGGASVVLACVLGIINCNYKFTPRAIAAARDSQRLGHQSSRKQDMLQPRNQDMVQFHPLSAKDVLQSLLMVNEHVASSKWKIFPNFPKKLTLPSNPSTKDCEELKIKAAELIKAGMNDEAERQLRDIYNAMVIGTNKESAYQVQMALVAILIFQGKYQEASKCDCLKHPIPSDDRVYLYKAIIHTMLDENKEAKECWESFICCFDNEGMPMPQRSSKHKGGVI